MSTPDANLVLRDPHRLAVLRETQLLDTPPEECFDRLTRMAVTLLRVPVAYISLVDDTRDFCKSGFGLPAWVGEKREIPGDTFAHDTIARDAPLAISDAKTDAVTIASTSVAAFAGVPITVEGAAIGVFCAIDTKVREWSENDVAVLVELVRTVVREIEMRQALRALREKAAAYGVTAERSAVAGWRLAGETAGLSPANRQLPTANRPQRVVVAEDDASMRRLIAKILSNDGYEIVEARDGDETLEILRSDRVSALILDLVMPGVSGWEVLQQRANDAAMQQVPVIVVSAKRGPDIARALAYGVFGLLPKPFDPADLRDLVKTCVNETRAH